ncbi:MAG: porin family protein [Gammaproteobacteria bacterium]|nr:MAG: porin family protein [Gammaproteobacteria bacterium]
MLKKILIASAILASTIAMADPAPYIGAGLGIVANTTKDGGNGDPANFRGVPFNLFAGYGGVVNQNLYLGGELTGTVGTGEISDQGRLKTSYSYGASVVPGVMLSDHTLAFGRVGAVKTRFSDQDKSTTGTQLGLGLQTSVTQNVDLRGEYDFTAYNSFTSGNERISAPRSDAFNLGVVYKFD